MVVVNGSVMLQSMRDGGIERDKGRDSEGGGWSGTAGGSIVIITNLLRTVSEIVSSDRVKYGVLTKCTDVSYQ